MTGRALRVVQVGGEWSGTKQGGGNRYFSGLLQALPACGVNCVAMAVGMPGTRDPAGASIGTVKDSLRRRSRNTKRLVADANLVGDIDVVVSHFAPYGLPSMQVARRAGLPFIVQFHGPWADEAAAEGGGRISVAMKRLIERRVYNRADHLIALSVAFKQVLVGRYGVAADRITVVPGGIDVDAWTVRRSRAEARETFGWPSDRPIILCVRRLARRMGIDLLLETFAKIRSGFGNAELVIAGRGEIADELRAQADDLGIGAAVRWLGFVAEEMLPLYYRAADVSVVPSRSLEGFGLTTLESMAAGTPCLVTPVGGLPEAVGGLDPSLVFRSASVEAIAKGLGHALAHPELLPTADACQRYVRDNFAWPKIATRVAQVYREAVSSCAG